MALRQRLYLSLLVVTILSLLTPPSLFAQEEVLPPPVPTYGIASVDRNFGEWNTTTDYYGDLYVDGIITNPLLARYFMRYDCRVNRRNLYVMVTTINGARFNTAGGGSFDQRIGIWNNNFQTYVIHVGNGTGDNNSAPDFVYENATLSNPQFRYEASFPLTPGYYPRIQVSSRVLDSNGIQRLILPAGGSTPDVIVNVSNTNPSLCSLAVTMESITATAQEERVLVAWSTATEVGNLGFNVYRSTVADEVGEPLNSELIPSAAPGSGQGATYEFYDETGTPGVTYYYRVEDMDADGTATMHDPVSATYPLPPTAVNLGMFLAVAHEPRWGFGTGIGAVVIGGLLGWRRWVVRRKK